MSMASVRHWRALPFLKRGMRVEVAGKPGRITGTNGSQNLQVRFDGLKFSQNCHPTWDIVYFDKDGSVLADFRTKRTEKAVTI